MIPRMPMLIWYQAETIIEIRIFEIPLLYFPQWSDHCWDVNNIRIPWLSNNTKSFKAEGKIRISFICFHFKLKILWYEREFRNNKSWSSHFIQFFVFIIWGFVSISIGYLYFFDRFSGLMSSPVFWLVHFENEYH